MPNLEYAVNDASGTQRIFKTFGKAAELAVAMSASHGGTPVNVDVLCWTRGAAVAYGGDVSGEIYDEDPEASVHDRIVIRAESQGRIA